MKDVLAYPPGDLGEGRVSASGRGSRRVGAPSRQASWAALWAVAAVAVFAAALLEARHQAVQSDGASIALQAWQMLHGNPLLRGWHTTDVSFYTTELPVYMLVEAFRGLRTDVVAICAALNYTLLVACAALLARGRARGREGLARALLAAGIMLAPSLSAATWLLSDSDHAATAVWVLLALLVIDRRGRRWYVPVTVGLVLAWAIVGDPLVEVIGAAPLALVCGLRAGQVLLIRRGPLWSAWYELSLAAAGVMSVVAAAGAEHLIRSAGGWVPGKGIFTHFVGAQQMPSNLAVEFRDSLGLFSADFFGQQIGIAVVPVLIHLAGAFLVALAVWAALRALPRGTGLVSDALVTGIIANLAAYLLLYTDISGQIREIAPVFALGATLAGRLLGGPLVRNRMEPLLAVGLACYLLTMVPAVTSEPATPANLALSRWLESHHLDSGIAGYWQANSITFDSAGTVTMRSVRPGPHDWPIPKIREMDVSQMDPATNYANFLVLPRRHPATGPSMTVSSATGKFGKPARVIRYRQYVIVLWNKNLLVRLHANLVHMLEASRPRAGSA